VPTSILADAARQIEESENNDLEEIFAESHSKRDKEIVNELKKEEHE